MTEDKSLKKCNLATRKAQARLLRSSRVRALRPGLVAMATLAVIAGAACESRKGDKAAQAASKPEQNAEPVEAVAPAVKSPFEKILEMQRLSEAVDFARPFMSDTRNDVSPGAVLLGSWAAQHLRWSDLMAVPETRQALVMKDPDSERGKRICARGRLIEIKAEKTEFGKFFEGGIFNGGGNSIVRFLAVGSTGELVEKRRARFCGLVIGTQSYANSGGGTTHTAYLVGMFDLPENNAETL